MGRDISTYSYPYLYKYVPETRIPNRIPNPRPALLLDMGHRVEVAVLSQPGFPWIDKYLHTI